MGLLNNFYGVDLSSARNVKFQDKSNKGNENAVNESANEKPQKAPEAKPISASALDAMASIARSEIKVKSEISVEERSAATGSTLPETDNVTEPDTGGRDGMTYEEVVQKYYDMANSGATDAELIPLLREIIDKWTPDSISMFGETRNLWQSTLAFRINRCYFTDTLAYLEGGGDPNQVDFDEIASFEKDLADSYKVPQDKYYEQNRRCVYGALINLYSIMLMRPGLSEEDKEKIEIKLEDARTKLEQFQ